MHTSGPSSRSESSPRLVLVAQALLDLLVAPPAFLARGVGAKLLRAGYRLLRRLLLLVAGDPLLVYRLDGSVIRLPLSHQLPLIRSLFPCYSTNIGRIAAAVKGAYPDLAVVDVGANVGDTVCIVRNLAQVPMLCIEGDGFFSTVLADNVGGLPEIELVACLIGDEDGLFRGQLETRGGTARLVGGEGGDRSLATRRLDTVLAEHSRFIRSKLVKLDTDGFDTRIIKAASRWLAETRPVLFFEYDPAAFHELDPEGYAVFATLRTIGYQGLLIFRNTGAYLMQLQLGDEHAIEQFHACCLAATGDGYFDLCAFHFEDQLIAEAVRAGEVDFNRRTTQSESPAATFKPGRGN